MADRIEALKANVASGSANAKSLLAQLASVEAALEDQIGDLADNVNELLEGGFSEALALVSANVLSYVEGVTYEAEDGSDVNWLGEPV